MTSIQFRRRLIVAILLGVAIVGAVMRHYAEPGSTTRNIGTLLMVMWVPIVGNIVAWLVGRFGKRAAAPAEPTGFDMKEVFAPQLRVALTFRPPALPSHDVPVAAGEYRCALVLATEGFSARWVVPPGEALARGEAHELAVEFLSPEVAAPRFPPGTAFRVLVGDSFIADGRVLQPSE